VRDNNLTVGVDDYLRLVLKKTASFIHPMRIGALIANSEHQNLSRFDRFGYLLGLAFQITDDVLNLIGTVGPYGKEIDGDLWKEKRTIVLTHALSHANQSDRTWISGFLTRPRERRLPAKSFDSIRFLRASAASNGRSSRLRHLQRPQHASFMTRHLLACPQALTLNGCATAQSLSYTVSRSLVSNADPARTTRARQMRPLPGMGTGIDLAYFKRPKSPNRGDGFQECPSSRQAQYRDMSGRVLKMDIYAIRWWGSDRPPATSIVPG
jgi:Polyprenyl synthetase